MLVKNNKLQLSTEQRCAMLESNYERHCFINLSAAEKGTSHGDKTLNWSSEQICTESIILRKMSSVALWVHAAKTEMTSCREEAGLNTYPQGPAGEPGTKGRRGQRDGEEGRSTCLSPEMMMRKTWEVILKDSSDGEGDLTGCFHHPPC
ncbi:hypothetical protein INR49_014456 [Caranx melampygus]|nr:hypothetical protein INR49_014456 [Caranx melampygus]